MKGPAGKRNERLHIFHYLTKKQRMFLKSSIKVLYIYSVQIFMRQIGSVRKSSVKYNLEFSKHTFIFNVGCSLLLMRIKDIDGCYRYT